MSENILKRMSLDYKMHILKGKTHYFHIILSGICYLY